MQYISDNLTHTTEAIIKRSLRISRNDGGTWFCIQEQHSKKWIWNAIPSRFKIKIYSILTFFF